MAPILTIVVGQYWTRKENPLRTSCWFAASPVGSLIADAITYCVSDHVSHHSKYQIWQIRFVSLHGCNIVKYTPPFMYEEF